MKIDLEAEKKEILKRYKKLLRAAKRSTNDVDKKIIRKSFDVALEAHKEMRRKSGEPYIYHPIAVAQIVAEEIGLGTISIASALLHDTVEDTNITLEDIDNMFGKKVCTIIDGLTKISGVIDHSDPNYSIQAENFRKMMLTLSDDVRVILVKLADRLHNMRTMEFMARHKQIKISYETLFIYAPLAHRLGLNTIKSELENLAFQYTEPELCKEISSKLKANQKKLTRFINKFSLPIINKLSDKGLEFDIKGRPKSAYSIARKMKTKQIPFEEVYDVFAIRIIIDTSLENEKSDCWSTYSVVTELYKPRPDRLRDWISNPKINGYESLHTTVMGPDGTWVEVQIRTKRMNDIAEKGLAAHWKYKDQEGKASDTRIDDWISKIELMLENPSTDAIDFIDDVKLNLFSDEIIVFTPKGEMKTLPKGATVLDFAYDIHSKIGNICIGAKVNHKLVPLSYELVSGEQIEILTSKKQIPKEDWLDSVKTGRAKHSIKSEIKSQRRKTAAKGKELFKEYTIDAPTPLNPKILAELVKHFDVPDSTEFYLRIALKQIEKSDLDEFIKEKGNRKKKSSKNQSNLITSKSFGKGDVLVLGQENSEFEYKLSPCCNPIPGDEVFGFVTTTDGIKIHKLNCPNSMHLQANFAYRAIKAKWDSQSLTEFLTGIRFTGSDDVGLLSKIVDVISQEKGLNIKSIHFDSEHGVFEGKVMLYVYDTHQLDKLNSDLLDINGIHDIKRIHTN